MTGQLYIWIIGAIFLGVVGVMSVMGLLMWLGHRQDRRGGAKHGFLERRAGAEPRRLDGGE